jgi:hypothetical protein
MTSVANSLEQTTEIRRRRCFRCGLILTWTPFVLIAVPSVVLATSRSVYKQRGLGFAAFSGLSTFSTVAIAGLITTLEVTALVLLLRAISKDQPMRSAVAIMTMCCSTLMIALIAFYLWLIFVAIPTFGS